MPYFVKRDKLVLASAWRYPLPLSTMNLSIVWWSR